MTVGTGAPAAPAAPAAAAAGGPERRRSVIGALGAVAACEAVGGLSGLAARRGVSEWLPTLDRPAFQPPDWVFGPVWSVLYAMIGLSWYLVRTTPDGPERASAERWMAIHLALNGLWSQLFFGRRRIGLGLLDSGALLVAVAVATVKVGRISRVAGMLLFPYLAWVTFATLLNAELWRRNR